MGIGASRFLAWKQQWPIVLSPTAILLAFGFSAAIGIFFGSIPPGKPRAWIPSKPSASLLSSQFWVSALNRNCN